MCKCNCTKVLKKLEDVEYKIDLLTDEYDWLNREVYANKEAEDYFLNKMIEYR